MNGKLDKARIRQALKDLKAEVPKLIQEVKENTGMIIEEITVYLNEKIPGLNKTKSAVDKWAQGKSAPENKQVKSVVERLKELLKPPVQDIMPDFETIRSAIEPLFISDFFQNIPQDLIDFWNKPYNNTFQLYNWPNTFSIIRRTDLRQELETLNTAYPYQSGMYAQISKLLPFAKDGQNTYLSYGFNNADKNFGVYLWNNNGDYEYPVFIANSITDLINHYIITLENEDTLHFDSEQYLTETFEKNTKGYILPLNFNINFNDGSKFLTQFKKMVNFYETAFRMFNRGSIKLEISREIITASIERADLTSITYNIKTEQLFFFIEKLNDELNGFDKSNFCRPKFYGYYLINEKYVAYLRLDIATDLIQKGYINSRFKMLPMLAFYNPRLANTIFNPFRTLAETHMLENQKLTWIE